MEVRNISHYWTFNSALYNRVLDPFSFAVQSSKRSSYYQRLYWEFEYTKKVNGVTFFYTLTYNDKSIPKFLPGTKYEHNCFCYDDVRLVTNGCLSKYLNRYHGARLRYFCACESGEGGDEKHHQRGKGNNPHYHFIFFVQPLHDKQDRPLYDKYKPVSTKDFESVLKRVWIGYDCWFPWQLAKFGSVQPGRFGAVVKDSRAFKYVGKYCIKSVEESDFLNGDLRAYYYHECKTKGYDTFDFWHTYYLFFRQKMISYDRYSFMSKFGFDRYIRCLRRCGFKSKDYTYTRYITDYGSDDQKVFLCEAALWFDNVYINLYINDKLRYYINNFSPKVRCSKTLGIYGLNFVDNVSSDPTFNISSPSGYDVVKPSLFYFRKLYYNTIVCPVTGNILYRLNELGKTYKINSLDRIITTFYNHTRDNISRYHSNVVRIVDSDTSDTSYPETFIKKCLFRSDLDSALFLYSQYTVIYKHHFYNKYSVPVIDPKNDFKRFIPEDFTIFDFDDMTISLAVVKSYGYLPYSEHPKFKDYFYFFKFLDDLNHTFDVIVSDSKKQRFSDRSEYLKRLNASIYNQPYSIPLYDSSALVI